MKQMIIRRTWIKRTLAAATTACLLCFTAAWADHKPGHNPPGGGGGGAETPPSGTVYFIHEDAVWRMGADGSNPAPLMERVDTFSDPSHQRHAGDYWFTDRDVPSGAANFPNGRPFFEIWAISESGAMAPLVAQPDIEVLSPAVWTPDDLSISFLGERWLTDQNGQPIIAVDAGLYTVDVAYDAGGAVAGSVPGSLTFLADLSTELRADAAGFAEQAEVAGHSWAPDPDRSAFTFGIRTAYNISPVVQEIWLVDLSLVDDPHAVPDQSLALLDSGKGIGWPEWSPDGRRIAYVSWNGTYLYDFATDRTKLLQSTPNDGWGLAEWSPDGSHFVVSHWDNFSGYDGMYRFSAKLTGKTELTAGLCPPDAPSYSCVLIPLGWRD